MAQRVGSTRAAPDQVAVPEAGAVPEGKEAGAVPEGKGAPGQKAAREKKVPAKTGTGRVRGWLRRTPPAAAGVAPSAPSVMAAGAELDLASNDPLVGFLLSAASAVDITGLRLQSPALKTLQEAGVVLVVPLISSGSLVGLLSLGPRRSERGYSTDDLRLLNSLAGYAAPAMRVGQLVRQQQAEARQRERIEPRPAARHRRAGGRDHEHLRGLQAAVAARQEHLAQLDGPQRAADPRRSRHRPAPYP